MAHEPITVSFTALQESPELLGDALERALGPSGLGVVIVNDLPPSFQPLRERMFHMAYRLANLPAEVQDTLSRADTSYLFGWSHGKELMNGVPDTQKGSFYANPLIDLPEVPDALRSRHPEYYSGNVWPTGIDGLEEFETTFKSLGRLVFDVGCALARACEAFVPQASRVKTIEELISSSQCNKARLLHYYPITGTGADSTNDALCGTHLDHSLLTGLCSALYLSETPSGDVKATHPPASSGLFIFPRGERSRPVQVHIPPDCLAFQTGEALQVLTGGRLVATPHFVSGKAPTAGAPVSRETFAFFLQPDVDAVIGADGETFGRFTKRVLDRHYASEG
ncbi:Clavaminate synthase-like protein [Papiliotrema laurentii]|uniref:Clavaminate synthase-like protein n=1 Tax=Papiliotrema laurentii TaxID=5418 RepID=A0AAD9FRD7_PAPLA|nr:Clavaminate synthase-like protein [Papiliotrema laurentii]